MTCCDISATTKPPSIAKVTALSVYEEFFLQGDEELAIDESSKIPEMMNRHACNIPNQQIGFINFIANTAYKNLVAFFPQLKRLIFIDLFISLITL